MIYFFILIGTQIILESLPISSSGHVILVENFLKFFTSNKNILTSLNEIETHLLHGPTIFIVALFFLNRWTILFYNKRCWSIAVKLTSFIFIADFITFLFYVLFKKCIPISAFPIGVGFMISAIALFSLKFCLTEKYKSINWKIAIVLGVTQGLSLLPGISRLGLTFTVARWMKIPSTKAFEFSFAMQWPLIVAGFLHGLKVLPQTSLINRISILHFNGFCLLTISSIMAFTALYFVQLLVISKKMWIFSIFLCFSFISWIILAL